MLEVGALVGLVAVVVVSLFNIQTLNAEYADASQAALPTVEPTPLAGGVLPSGHAPPEEAGSRADASARPGGRGGAARR